MPSPAYNDQNKTFDANLNDDQLLELLTQPLGMKDGCVEKPQAITIGLLGGSTRSTTKIGTRC